VLNAQILLGADTGGLALSDPEIVRSYHVSGTTVQRIREKFVLQGLDIALKGLPRGPHTRHIKIDGEVEAQLARLVCSQVPAGYTRWTLQLLADKMVELQYVDSLSHESARQVLKKKRN
jgi:hypothetical protein